MKTFSCSFMLQTRGNYFSRTRRLRGVFVPGALRRITWDYGLPIAVRINQITCYQYQTFLINIPVLYGYQARTPLINVVTEQPGSRGSDTFL